MHRPTHDPKLEKTGEYPFSWHLKGRRRNWEIRLQISFKQVPSRNLNFGIELGAYVPTSLLARQAQHVLVSACRGIVGDCYHSPGSDPKRTVGELELPVFAMPLWAFDQFHVSEPGTQPPNILGDLTGVGMRRRDGIRAYVKAMRVVAESFSTDKIYTLCFWGVSQYLDVLQWVVSGGILPGIRLDFNKLCGTPPVYVTVYELQATENKNERRHLESRKKHFIKIAVWSELRSEKRGRMEVNLDAFINDDSGPPPTDVGFDDLLGLCEVSPVCITDTSYNDLIDTGEEPLALSAGSFDDVFSTNATSAISATDTLSDLLGPCSSTVTSDGRLGTNAGPTTSVPPASSATNLPLCADFDDLLGLGDVQPKTKMGSDNSTTKIDTCDLLGLAP